MTTLSIPRISSPTPFVLPGRILNPKNDSKYKVTYAAAMSRVHNPRNLESPWYAPWGRILDDLTSDRVELNVKPQYTLFYNDPQKLVRKKQLGSIQPLESKQTRKFLQHVNNVGDNRSRDDDDDGENAGNTTIASIATIPKRPDFELYPDFAIVRDNPLDIDRIMTRSAGDVRIVHVGVPLLGELKRNCTRREQTAEKALDKLGAAVDQVEAQGHLMFLMYPDETSTILMAMSGPWWMYRFATRDDVLVNGEFVIPVEDNDSDDEEGEEEETTVDDEIPFIPPPFVPRRSVRVMAQAQSDKSHPNFSALETRQEDIQFPRQKSSKEPHRLGNSGRRKTPDASKEPFDPTSHEWSGVYHLETVQSDEAFCTIHERLKVVVQ